MEYITTNSSCDSGDPATNTMAYYYPPGLNPFLVDDKDSLSSAGSNNTAELPPSNFSPRTPPQQIAMSYFKLQAFWRDIKKYEKKHLTALLRGQGEFD